MLQDFRIHGYRHDLVGIHAQINKHGKHVRMHNSVFFLLWKGRSLKKEKALSSFKAIHICFGLNPVIFLLSFFFSSGFNQSQKENWRDESCLYSPQKPLGERKREINWLFCWHCHTSCCCCAWSWNSELAEEELQAASPARSNLIIIISVVSTSSYQLAVS